MLDKDSMNDGERVATEQDMAEAVSEGETWLRDYAEPTPLHHYRAFVRVTQTVDACSADDREDLPAGEDYLGAFKDYSVNPDWAEEEAFDWLHANVPMSHPEDFTWQFLYSRRPICSETHDWKDRRIQQLEQWLIQLGFCPRCEHLISHDIEEPFAHCDCGTSEWTGRLPVLVELHDMARDILLALEPRATGNAHADKEKAFKTAHKMLALNTNPAKHE